MAESAIVLVLAAGVVVVATMFSRGGADVFRLPKELAFRAEAIVLLMLGAFWITAKRRTWRFGRRREFLSDRGDRLLDGDHRWTSTNRQLTADSLITVVAAAVIFIATCLAAQGLSLCDRRADGRLLHQRGVVILQETEDLDAVSRRPVRRRITAASACWEMPNDVGTYLAAPAVAAVVLAVTAAGSGAGPTPRSDCCSPPASSRARRGRRSSRSSSALIVFARPLLATRACSPWRRPLAFALVARCRRHDARPRCPRSSSRPPRITTTSSSSPSGSLPFLAAIDMTRDHPLLGVGPGCFKYHYMPYRVALVGKYPGDVDARVSDELGRGAQRSSAGRDARRGVPGYAALSRRHRALRGRTAAHGRGDARRNVRARAALAARGGDLRDLPRRSFRWSWPRRG